MSSVMTAKFSIGEKVMVTPPAGAITDVRDADVSQYVGQRGTVSDSWWVDSARGDVFYIYKVKLGGGEKEVVLHEDELMQGKM